VRQELDEALCAKYPEIFKDRHGDETNTAMCWGFECGDGWYDLIDRTCARLMEISRGIIEPPPVASQVKEKFGGLRFYIDQGTDEHFDACFDAETESYSICETCGAPGKVRGKFWLYTACDDHTDPRDLVVDITP